MYTYLYLSNIAISRDRYTGLSTENTKTNVSLLHVFSTNSFCFSPGNKKKIINILQNTSQHILTHINTSQKKNFHILITPCSQRTLMDSPLVMKMCTNLSLLYYYSIDQRLVMDRVQAQFSPPRYLPNNTTFLPFRAGPRAHPRAKWAKFRTITTQRPLL